MMFKVVSSIIKRVDAPVRIFFYFSIFDLLVGLVGMLVYGILAATDGPIWIRNQFVGLWLLTMVAIYGILSLYLEIKNMSKKKDLKFYFDLSFFVLSTLICLLLCIFFGLSGKIDATIWSVYICAVSLTNCSILFIRTKPEEPKTIENQSFQEDVTETNTEVSENHLAFSVSNIIMKVISLLFVCFILAGSIEYGSGKVK